MFPPSELQSFFVSASFLCNMVIDGLGYSFGVLLEPIQREFKVTGSNFRIHVGDPVLIWVTL